MLTTDLLDTQRGYESAALEKGFKRYHERQLKKASREGLDRRENIAKLMRGAIPIVAQGIREWLAVTGAAKGRKPASYGAISLLDADLLAYAGLSRIFRELGDGGRVSSIVIRIGRAIQVELEASAIAQKSPKDAKRYRKLAEGEASEAALEKRHERMVDELEIDLGWSRSTQGLVGQTILNIVLVQLKDIFERAVIRANGNQIAVIRIRDEAVAVLAEMADAVAWMKPVLEPMVVLPRPWTTLSTGCYLDPKMAKAVPLVRTYSGEHKRLLRDAIKDGSMQEVLDAVNAVQETKWAIDTRVLDVIKWTYELGLKPSKSFPLTDLPEVPKKAPAEEWDAMNKAQRIASSRKRKAVKDIRGAAGVDAATFKSDVEMADKLAGHDFFCLPHSLDFRGRVYAVSFFNHQRSDHLKGMFRFDQGIPMGPDGGDWLAIHLANCGDFGKASKKPFDQRIAWVRENEGDVLMCARYPQLTYDYWSKADSPFCFLQACMEYDAWMQSGFSPDFLSVIPIAADGSCSGLQHYAALTRSAPEAHHVNLTPRDDVGDIYQIVANEAVPTLQAAAAREDVVSVDGVNLPQRVLDNDFGRSQVKRNVMTYFYGSGKFGMRDQHIKDLMIPLADRVALGEMEAHPYEVLTERKNKETGEVTQALDGGYSCAQVMAAHVYAAVVTVAPKADEAATWIQSVAAILAHESLSMIWRTPTGMPVVQRYSEYVSKTVNLWLYDREVRVPAGTYKTDVDGNVLTRVQVLVQEAPTKRVEKKRMRSASSPNVIHSMDGAHLQRSVVMGKAAGIEHFAMIHDSFGTHAGNMTTFSRVIREAFIATYQDYCPLVELDRYARSVLSEEGIEKLPPIPAKGDLDLNAIRESLYAFA